MFTAKRKGFLAFFAALILASLIGLGLIFIPDNTRALAANAEDGTATETDATTPDSSHVAQVGETGYDTLQEAINAAGDATVKLLSDVKEDVSIEKGQTITIDLNGYTLTNVEAHTIINQGILTVVDNSAEKDGTVTNVTGARAAVYNSNGATINLLGGVYTRAISQKWYVIVNDGTMIVDGIVARNENSSDPSSLIINNYSYAKNTTPAVLTINEGTFTCAGGNVIKNDEGGSEVYIKGALLQVVHLQTQQRKIGPLWLLMVVLLKTLLRMEQLYM